jgi:hypothetical protein
MLGYGGIAWVEAERKAFTFHDRLFTLGFLFSDSPFGHFWSEGESEKLLCLSRTRLRSKGESGM